ncbi:MAG: aminodeoxychorismate lyase [SAR86 cluster bacterium]|uniref:Aminodeoxychorismate lyase n=1 Tax=SAR86 cluster bacterium TaxID=2030880 RepID=A0A2A5B3E3_9GAMM|nr:MAG: aminodeoxychorismate lyase [SAR86 cluster bacterium]
MINGQLTDQISVTDRGFQYGDGCFETIRVQNSLPVLLAPHLSRLTTSCELLGIDLDKPLLMSEIEQMLSSCDFSDAVLKITITRGSGGRGYKPAAHCKATRVVQLFEYSTDGLLHNESGVEVFLCRHRLSSNRDLMAMKHLNRLDQVMASREIPPGIAEGLCLSQQGYLIEGCKSNIVLVKENMLLTPDLTESGVKGIMLSHLLNRFRQDEMPVKTTQISLDDLKSADEVFLCNSVFGVCPVIKLSGDDTVLFWSKGSVTRRAIQYTNEAFSAAS